MLATAVTHDGHTITNLPNSPNCGRSGEALTLYRAPADDRTRVHGPGHPETLRSRHGLGVNLGRLGRWEEALAEARDVCTLRERVLGPDHPDVLVRSPSALAGWTAGPMP